MANRDKYELDRLRGYYDPDDDEDISPFQVRVAWFGLRLKVVVAMFAGGGLAILMFVMLVARWLLAGHLPWADAGIVWPDYVFLGVMAFISIISFTLMRVATKALRREINAINARIARSENATEEEVQEYVRDSERRLRRSTLRDWLLLAAFMIPLTPLFGTKLVFSWGGIVPLFCAAILTLFMITIGAQYLYKARAFFLRILGRTPG